MLGPFVDERPDEGDAPDNFKMSKGLLLSFLVVGGHGENQQDELKSHESNSNRIIQTLSHEGLSVSRLSGVLLEVERRSALIAPSPGHRSECDEGHPCSKNGFDNIFPLVEDVSDLLFKLESTFTFGLIIWFVVEFAGFK